MKKLISLLLTLTMLLSLATPVFASTQFIKFFVADEYAQVGSSFTIYLSDIPAKCTMTDLNGLCNIGQVLKITGSTDYVVQIDPVQEGDTQLILADKDGNNLVQISVTVVEDAGAKENRIGGVSQTQLTYYQNNPTNSKLEVNNSNYSPLQKDGIEFYTGFSFAYLNVKNVIMFESNVANIELCDTADIIKASTPMSIANTNQYVVEIKGTSAGKTQLYVMCDGEIVSSLVPLEIINGQEGDETLTYCVDDINQKATVADVMPGVTGNITIPLSYTGYNTYPITAIGDSAFANTDGLLSLTVRDNVVTIGKNAFDGLSDDFKILCYEDSPISEWAKQNGVNYENVAVPYGDVDNSGACDIFDLISLAKHTVDSSVLLDTRAANVDATDKADRNIDIFDLIKLAKHVCDSTVPLGPQ